MSSLASKLDAFTSDKNGTLAISVLGINRAGKPIYSHTSGVTSLDGSAAKPITQDSIFRLASCTKLITSIAALRLVQRGQLSLDDPKIIEKHLPELWQQDVFTSLPGQQPFSFAKREREITLRMLLSHSSGVGYDMLDPRLQGWRAQRGQKPLALVGPVVDAFSVPLVHQPGEGWAYGGGLDWTGLLVERVTGVGFGQFVRKEVLDVVGCDAGIGFIEDVDKENCVMTVTRDEQGTLKEWVVVPQRAQLGGGGMFASTRNFVRVLADLISTEPKLLSQEMVSVLFAPQFKEGDRALQMLRTTSSAQVFAAMIGPLASGLKPEVVNHALGGVLIMEDTEVGKTKGTMAWGGSFNLLWFANREAGVAGFFASSLFPPADEKTRGLMGDFVKEVWARLEDA